MDTDTKPVFTVHAVQWENGRDCLDTFETFSTEEKAKEYVAGLDAYYRRTVEINEIDVF